MTLRAQRLRGISTTSAPPASLPPAGPFPSAPSSGPSAVAGPIAPPFRSGSVGVCGPPGSDRAATRAMRASLTPGATAG